MHVAHDIDGCLQPEEVVLAGEDLLEAAAERPDFVLSDDRSCFDLLQQFLGVHMCLYVGIAYNRPSTLHEEEAGAGALGGSTRPANQEAQNRY